MDKDIARRRMLVLAVVALAAWMAALFSLALVVTVLVRPSDRVYVAPAVSCRTADFRPAIFGSIRPCGPSRVSG